MLAVNITANHWEAHICMPCQHMPIQNVHITLTLHDFDLVFMLGSEGGGGGVWAREEGWHASVTSDFVRRPWDIFQLCKLWQNQVFLGKTWYCLNSNRVFFVPKRNQRISTALSQHKIKKCTLLTFILVTYFSKFVQHGGIKHHTVAPFPVLVLSLNSSGWKLVLHLRTSSWWI